MPQIVVSTDLLKAIKEYLVDVEGLTIGQFVEDAVFFALENVTEFEEYIELEEVESEEEGYEEESWKGGDNDGYRRS